MFIWFFGPSSVGKKTLIYSLSSLDNPRRCALSQKLSLTRGELLLPVVIKNKVKSLSVDEKYQLSRDRLNILQQIYGSGVQVKWLIHGQGIDFSHKILGELHSEYKEADRRAVFIYLYKKTYLERSKSRGYDIPYERAYADVDATMEQLKREFPIFIAHRE